MSVLAPSEASRRLLWILGSGAVVLIFPDAFWPLALLWVATAALVLCCEHAAVPDPFAIERIGGPA